MTKGIVRAFASRSAAEKAVHDLKRAGYTDDQISLVGKDSQGNTVKEDGSGNDIPTKRAAEGAMAGAAAGAAGGALYTLGIMSGVVPVIGPIVALGTLGTILLNSAGTAAAVGIAGALTGWGLSEADSQYYEDEVKAGRYLVLLDDGDRSEKAHRVFSDHGGYEKATAPKF